MPGKVATRCTLVLLRHESGIVCDRQRMRAFSDTKVGPLHLAMPVIRRILHSSDFSEASLIAFGHALKAALIGKSKLTLIHVSDDEIDGTEFPGVRETLERWKLLPPGSPQSAVAELGLDVEKVIGLGSDPVKGVLQYLAQNGADLIVLATHHHGAHWLHHSISELMARKAGEMTLFIPAGTRGFVSLADGLVSLRKILIPLAAKPRPEPAINGAAGLVQQLDCNSGTFSLLHVGEEESMPIAATPAVPGWDWQRITKEGDVIEAILTSAREINADLIVMSTGGRTGLLDAFRGSHTERVLRHAPCPLLAIPESPLEAVK